MPKKKSKKKKPRSKEKPTKQTKKQTKEIKNDNLLFSNEIEKELNLKIKNVFNLSNQGKLIQINIKKDIDKLVNNYYNKFNKISELYQDIFKNVKIKINTVGEELYNKFYIDEYYPPLVNIFIILLESNLINNLELLNTTSKNEILELLRIQKNNNSKELQKYINTNIGKKINNQFKSLLFDSNNTQKNNFIRILKEKYPNCNIEKKENKLFYSEFLSLNIKDCIYKDINRVMYVDFNYIKDGLQINLNGNMKIFYKKNNKLNEELLVKKIVSRVLFFNIYKNKKKLQDKNIIPNINIFLCDEKKIMPTDNVFNVNNVNSAVTDTINSIIIFRKEEVLKSILHESIHFHNLDFNFYNYPKGLLTELLNIKKYKMDKQNKLRINEAYTEIIANMLNIIITLTEHNIIKSKSNNIITLNKNILKKFFLLELKFSMYQFNKIYKFINDINDTNNKKLIQNTSVFSYYIIKCQLFFNLNNLLDKLNNKNNTDLININYNIDFNEFQETFIAFTKKSNTDKNKLNLFMNNLINNFFIKKNNNNSEKIINTLRMTCME